MTMQSLSLSLSVSLSLGFSELQACPTFSFGVRGRGSGGAGFRGPTSSCPFLALLRWNPMHPLQAEQERMKVVA